ncbi:hypothetical protein SprV_0702402100 [Sparganum proliferum]
MKAGTGEEEEEEEEEEERMRPSQERSAGLQDDAICPEAGPLKGAGSGCHRSGKQNSCNLLLGQRQQQHPPRRPVNALRARVIPPSLDLPLRSNWQSEKRAREDELVQHLSHTLLPNLLDPVLRQSSDDRRRVREQCLSKPSSPMVEGLSPMSSSLVLFGHACRQHQDWLDDNDAADISSLLVEKNRPHKAYGDRPTDDNRTAYNRSRRLVQQRLRKMQDAWTARKAEEIQGYADRNQWKNFLSAIKAV